MYERPAGLWLYILALLLIPFSIVMEVVMTGNYAWPDLDALLAEFSLLEWALTAFSLLQAKLFSRVSRFLVVSTPLFLALLFWKGGMALRVPGADQKTAIPVLGAILGLVAHILFFRRQEIRRIVSNPGLRWWRHPQRKPKSFKVIIRPVFGGEFTATSYDVSTGGIFIPLDEVVWNPLLGVFAERIKPGMRCSAKLIFSHLHSIQCNGEVVRCAESKGVYPRGFAVRFVNIESRQKKLLEAYVNDQVKEGDSIPLEIKT